MGKRRKKAHLSLQNSEPRYFEKIKNQHVLIDAAPEGKYAATRWKS